MPRTGWAAIGAVVAALIAADAGDVRLCLIGAVVCTSVLVMARSLPPTRRVAVAAAAAGALIVLVRAAAGGLLAVPAPALPDDGTLGSKHTGVVLSVGTPDGGLQRAVVELRPPEPAVTVYAWLPRYPQIVPEDVVAFDGRLEAPPADGDFADYLARSGVDYTDKARSLERLGADGSPLAALEGVRRAANDLIDRVLPEPQAGLATAMAIGLRDVVARDVSDDFRTSGLSHVVAISGWHIAMLGAVVAALLGGLPRRPRSVLVVLAIAAYSLLAGAAPSILRAALMAAVVIAARESGRRGQAKAGLALTCLALLVLDPATVNDVGFELSAVATAGLLAWASPLHEWLAAHVPRHTPAWLVEALAVSLAAPGRDAAPDPAPVRTAVARRAARQPAHRATRRAGDARDRDLPGRWRDGRSGPAGRRPGTRVARRLVVGRRDDRHRAVVRLAALRVHRPAATVQPCGRGGERTCDRRRHSPATPKSRAPTDPAPGRAQRKRPHLKRSYAFALGAAVALALLLAVVALARPDGRLHVTVLDIGQGDSILLEGPAGGRMLIDTGPDPDLVLARLDERIPAWDRRIDVVVLTHPHEDHVGGLALLLQRYRIGRVLESGMVGRGPGDAAYRRVLAEQDRSTTTVAAGDRLWLDGIELDVDWPPAGSVPARAGSDGKQVNNESVVIDLHFGARRMLFTGDMEEEIDPQLLARGLAEHLGGPIDVLKVAHHGSGTATTDALLDVLQPRIAVISVGADNNYGHPAPATLERLRSHGATVYRTDLDGSVEISTDGRDLVVGTERQRTPSAPSASSIERPEKMAVGRRRRQTYNRSNDRSVPGRGRRPAAQSAAEREAAAPLDGRGRGGRLPGRGHDPPRRRAGRHDSRDRRAAARPGQDAAR